MSVELSLDFDHALLTPDYLASPYPYYRELRDKDPIHWSTSMNAWVLTRSVNCIENVDSSILALRK